MSNSFSWFMIGATLVVVPAVAYLLHAQLESEEDERLAVREECVGRGGVLINNYRPAKRGDPAYVCVRPM